MQTIMIVVLEESEDIRDDLLLIILSALGRNKSVRISCLICLLLTCNVAAFMHSLEVIVLNWKGIYLWNL